MRAFATFMSLAAVVALIGCSAKSTAPPPPVAASNTYWTTFDGGPPNPNMEVAGFPLTNASVPSVIVNASVANGLSNAGYVQFDSSGRLWVENFTDPVVVNIFNVPLTASSTPAVTLTFSNIHHGFGMVFDSGGNVWMAAQTANSVYKFNGPFTANATLSSPALTLTASLVGPQGLTMDAAGDLIVAQGGVGTGTSCVGSIAIFKAPISNSTPVLLNGPASPDGVAVDSAGNLYAGGTNNAQAGCVSGVSRFSAANQANGAMPDIVDATGLPATFFSEALTIDPLGNLYYANCSSTSGNIIVYPTVATSFSTTLAPTVSFTDANIASSKCVGGVVFR